MAEHRDERWDCAQVRELLAELASGAVSGHERAAALDHVADCADCRAELAELTEAADALLLLAPEIEPPTGFESRVMARLGHRTGLRRSLLAAAASFVVAATLGVSATWWATAPDRELAEQTRNTFAIASGRYLRAVRLTDESGATAGTVFMYQGNPSWLLVSVTAAPADGPYEVVVTGSNGTTGYAIGTCLVSAGTGTTAYQLAGPVERITSILMTGPGAQRLTARA